MIDDARALSRRTFTTAVAGLAVVGYRAGAGSWVVSAHSPPSSTFDRIPELDGTLLLDDATRDAYAQDFGQIVHERPDAVLRPGSADDIAKMLRFARRHGIRVVGRGAATRRSASPSTGRASCSTSRPWRPSARSSTAASPSTPAAAGTPSSRGPWRRV
jgi:hypothetical protein